MSKKDKHQQAQAQVDESTTTTTELVQAEPPAEPEVSPTEAVELAAQPTLEQRVSQLEAKLDELSQRLGDPSKVDRRGRPVSQREMTDDDARAIMIGLHREVSHKKAAEELGLSYGQVYSARLGFTFKHIRKEMLEGGKTDIWTPKK